ncbi:hypothetical protein D781_1827 [Serratia sp. FGI94]|uniref:hypothetical protein n=1 Tax=Serratia sp. FGI94 TaxID=671990 RepID=UPI0002A72E59|nr:hypothetical protein [Serratia sp. FGI94]AGB82119.1 hypothetical protein D781_1827 [Serratia sp. FGI94]
MMLSNFKPTKVNFYLFVFLIIYFVVVIFLFINLLVLGISGYAYYKIGVFNFGWEDVIYSGKVGLASGIPIGIGGWVLSKLDELKRKKKPSFPKE